MRLTYFKSVRDSGTSSLPQLFISLRFIQGGVYLTSEAEQREAIVLLRDVKGTAGWETDHIIQTLERQWS